MFTKKGEGKTRQLAEGISLTTVASGDKTLMGRFCLKKGAMIPLHSHPHEQTGMMLSGKLRFMVEGNEQVAEAGDCWCFKGDVEHSAEALEDAEIVEVFSPLREDYL